MDYRLQYYNLKKERSQNALSLEEIQVILQKNPLLQNIEENDLNFCHHIIMCICIGPLASVPGLQ